MGQAADAEQQRGKVFAIDVFHGQEVLPIDLADVVNATDVRVGHLQGGADFVEKSIQPRLVLLQSGRQELEGNRLAELEVVGTIDFTHAAASEQADDAVTIGYHCPGNKPSAGAGKA